MLATEVHHRTPIQWGRTLADRMRLAYSPANLESLCHECHVRTHTEMGRRDAASERARVERETSEYLRRFYGEGKETGGLFFKGPGGWRKPRPPSSVSARGIFRKGAYGNLLPNDSKMTEA